MKLSEAQLAMRDCLHVAQKELKETGFKQINHVAVAIIAAKLFDGITEERDWRSAPNASILDVNLSSNS